MFKLLTLENLPTPAGKLSYKPSQQTTVIAAQNLFKTKETKAAERLKADSKIPLSASDETKMWEF